MEIGCPIKSMQHCTELAVFHVTEQGFLLTEIAADATIEDVLKQTDATVIVSPDCKKIEI